MRYVNLLGYLAIPLAFAVHYWLGQGKAWEPGTTFFLAALGVVPLAALMGHSTEALAERVGPTWGGLLNATFGNAAELIIAIIALSKGLNEIVKASLTGSILGNLLLVGGGAMVVGGWKREKQKFNTLSAESSAGMLALATAAMLLPAIFHYTAESMHDRQIAQHEHAVSTGTAIILIIIYALGLLFTLRTHRHIFSPAPTTANDEPGEQPKIGKAVTTLLLASGGIAIVAELLVGSAQQMGWNEVFVGIILLAIIGNAAEHSTAIMLAKNDDMDTAMNITYQSSLQIALFVTPLLVLLASVFVSFGVGHAKHLDLIFSPMEIVAVILSVAMVIILGLNGETNWLEGAMLLALYLILAIAFYYMPSAAPGVAH